MLFPLFSTNLYGLLSWRNRSSNQCCYTAKLVHIYHWWFLSRLNEISDCVKLLFTASHILFQKLLIAQIRHWFLRQKFLLLYCNYRDNIRNRICTLNIRLYKFFFGTYSWHISLSTNNWTLWLTSICWLYYFFHFQCLHFSGTSFFRNWILTRLDWKCLCPTFTINLFIYF